MKTELTWVADAKRKAGGRWRKKYRGEIFWYSEIEGKSDRAGYKRAVEAFKTWRAKIDLKLEAEKPYQKDYRMAIQLRQDMLGWLAAEQDPDPIRNRLLDELKQLEAEFAKAKPRPIKEIGILTDPIDRSVMSMSDVMEWMDRLGSLRTFHRWTNTEPKNNTLDGHIGEFVTVQMSRSIAGQINATTFKGYQERTQYFRNWLTTNGHQEISPRIVSGFNSHLLTLIGTGAITEQYGASLFSQAKAVVRWLWRNDLCELPKNLDDPMLHIEVALKEITPFSNDELQVIWDNASERTRLYALLMLNCGMLPTDISELKPSEYDGRRITRRRTKTGKQTTSGRGQNVPIVSWMLWDETRTLLDKHRSSDRTHLLLNQDGGVLHRSTLNPDTKKVSIVDNIDSAWGRMAVKMEKRGIVVRPLAYLRKTGPSKLEEHDSYGRYSQFFLGQAPDTMTEGRYAKPSQDVFDKAVIWLGEQFGFQTTPKETDTRKAK